MIIRGAFVKVHDSAAGCLNMRCSGMSVSHKQARLGPHNIARADAQRREATQAAEVCSMHFRYDL